jgi:hypothetical protein
MKEDSSEKTDNCTRCGIDRNINGFIKNRRYCRKCQNELSRQYKKNNREHIAEYNKEYKATHRDEISEYNAKYNIENRATIQKRHTPYLANKKKTDMNYKIALTLRNRIGGIFKKLGIKKHAKTLDILGCTTEFFKEWLEFQFEDGMTLENHGLLWHIDHILPCASFDMTKKEDVEKCFNWKNLQPLYAKDNLSKKDSILEDHIEKNKENIKKFMKLKNIE